MVQASGRSAPKCPACAGRQIRYSSSAVRHLIRIVFGSGKRYCLTCGYKWAVKARYARLHPLSWTELGSTAAAMTAASLVTAACAGLLFFGWTAIESRDAYSLTMLDPFLPYRAGAAAGQSPDRYRFPVLSLGWPRVSARYGYRYHPILHRGEFHRGMDLPMPWGTPVYPSRNGKVIEAGWAKGYGMRIVILHPDGESTLYGHLSRIVAMVGDRVEAGKTLIGRVGSTGLSTGPHLHFEIRNRGGRAVDPDAVLSP